MPPLVLPPALARAVDHDDREGRVGAGAAPLQRRFCPLARGRGAASGCVMGLVCPTAWGHRRHSGLAPLRRGACEGSQRRHAERSDCGMWARSALPRWGQWRAWERDCAPCSNAPMSAAMRPARGPDVGSGSGQRGGCGC